MDMSFQMSEAQPKDIPHIVQLVESVYRGESSQEGWTTEADLLSGQRTDPVMIGDMIDDPNSALLVYRSSEEIQACVYLERKEGHVLLGMLSVKAKLQGQQLGQKIISYCEQYIADNWGLSLIKIHVLWQRKELIAWYERRGFKKTGNTKPFPADPKFGIPKVSDLYFIEMEVSFPERK